MAEVIQVVVPLLHHWKPSHALVIFSSTYDKDFWTEICSSENMTLVDYDSSTDSYTHMTMPRILTGYVTCPCYIGGRRGKLTRHVSKVCIPGLYQLVLVAHSGRIILIFF